MGRTQTAYDRWAPTYDHDPNPQTTLETNDVLDLLRVDGESRVLDAACGTGRYVGPILGARARVVGFDLSLGMLARSRDAHPHVSFVQASLGSRLPYPSAGFTHVLCAQALKHVEDLNGAFAELARVLRPGGRLVFSVTHPEMDFSDYELSFAPSFILSREADIHHHTEQDYRDAIASAGLVVDEWRPVLVSTTIAHFLTPGSFERVEGRPQILVASAIRR
ncbi:MAG: methyltransferase domain-containing protein [Candidatus Eisenbacteria bacterium]